jgi:predicted MFS family arabinose efflux permease
MMHNSSINKIFILAISALCVVSQLYIPIPLMNIFHDIFALPNSKIMWIGSAFGFAYASGFLIFGPLSDRFGRKALLVPGLGSLGVVTLAISFVHSYEIFLLFRILQGFVAATFAPAALAYVSEQVALEKRPLGIALISTGFMLAGILGQIYASQVNYFLGWHAIFFLSGVIYIILCIVTTLFLTEKKDVPHKTIESLMQFYFAMLKHLTNKNLLKAYLCAFVLLLAFVAMYTGLGPYLQNAYHLSAADMFLVRLAGIPGMLIGPFTSIYIKKYGSRSVLMVGFFIAILGILGEASFNILGLIVLMSTFFVAGIAISAPALIANITSIATCGRGAAISLYTFILFVGAALGTILANYLLQYGFASLCWVIAAILLTSISVFLFRINRDQ